MMTWYNEVMRGDLRVYRYRRRAARIRDTRIDQARLMLGIE